MKLSCGLSYSPPSFRQNHQYNLILCAGMLVVCAQVGRRFYRTETISYKMHLTLHYSSVDSKVASTEGNFQHWNNYLALIKLTELAQVNIVSRLLSVYTVELRRRSTSCCNRFLFLFFLVRRGEWGTLKFRRWVRAGCKTLGERSGCLLMMTILS